MRTRLVISFVFVGFVIFGITNSSGVLDGILNKLDNATTNENSYNIPIECKGFLGKCYSGVISKVVDGDTIHLENGDSVRFTLVDAPEINTEKGKESKEYLESECPVGSTVYIDEDDGQLQGSYGRVIGLVYCEEMTMDPGFSLNAIMIGSGHGTIYKKYCDKSEFGNESWAKEYGC